MQEFDLPPAVARWLVTEGRDVVAVISAALAEGRPELTVASELRATLTPERAAAAMGSAHARLRARELRVPHADRILLTRTALEQASRPEVARHRARRYAGRTTVADLCAGAGIDALALASTGATVVAVDLDPSRAHLLAHNARVAGADVLVMVGDALAGPLRAGLPVHADPSRRRGRRRARRLDDYGPPFSALLEATAGAPGRGVVVAPGIDWDDPALPSGAEIEFVQVGRDLVEAMVWCGDLREPGVRATATLLPAGQSLSRGIEAPVLDVGAIGDWLVEVAPAAVRARLHDALGADIGAHRIARGRALLSTPERPTVSPWWTLWQVEEVLPPKERAVRAWLREAEELPLEIATHGLDADPQRWWRAIGTPPRGPGGRRLHLVRTDTGALCIATRTVPGPVGRTRDPEGGYVP